MSAFGMVIAVAVGWIAIGLLLSVVMGRRGHSGFGWFAMGALMGPLAVVLAIDSSSHDEEMRPTAVDVPGARPTAGDGPVDVLVGFDGSAECKAAADAAVHLLGPRLGRLTIASVVPYDGGREAQVMAVAALERHAGLVAGHVAQLEILRGRPSSALSRRAVEGGYDLVVVGTRGSGLSKAILGSAAVELSRDSKVPVLLAGGGNEPS